MLGTQTTHNSLYLIQKGTKIIGFGQVSVQSRGRTKIINLDQIAIEEEHQGKGYGSNLMKVITQDISKNIIPKGQSLLINAAIQNNPKTRNFYTKNGFNLGSIAFGDQASMTKMLKHKPSK